MGSLTDIDFSEFDLDEPIGELTTNGQQGTLKRFLASRASTLREIAQQLPLSAYEDLVGTPDTVAGADGRGDARRSAATASCSAATLTRRYVAEITDGLVPALQRTGLVRDGLRAPALPRQPLGLLMPPLGKMILRRLLWVFPVAFGVVTMTFFMARVLNGDPTELYAPPEATDALRAEIRAKLGLADPLPIQFIHYLWDLLRFDSRHLLHDRPERARRICGIGCPRRWSWASSGWGWASPSASRSACWPPSIASAGPTSWCAARP